MILGHEVFQMVYQGCAPLLAVIVDNNALPSSDCRMCIRVCICQQEACGCSGRSF